MTAAKKVYSEQQMKEIAVRSFQTGLRIGKREATRYDETLASGPESPGSRDVITTSAPRTRGHLTLLQGGAA
jgi:hypothetical protein